eukprot:636865-Pyramimonas_sp.AAC.1
MRVGHKQYPRVLQWGVQALQSSFHGHRIETRPRRRPKRFRPPARLIPDEIEQSAHRRHVFAPVPKRSSIVCT